MTLPIIQNQDRAFFTDATVTQINPTTGSAISLIGEVKTLKISIKRDFKNVKAATDTFVSKRAVSWGEGSVEASGFDQLTGSRFTACFVASATNTFQFQEAASGDLWQLQCTNEGLDISLSDNPNETSLKMGQVGIPYYGAGGSAVSALALGT
jgi:hypothetical protein